MEIRRIDPRDLDLDTADAMAEVDRASIGASGLPFPGRSGPALMLSLQHQSDSRPVDGLWLARDGEAVVGFLAAELPWRDNAGTGFLRGVVHPDHRRSGIGTALHGTGLTLLREAGRCTAYSGAMDGTDGVPALKAWGYRQTMAMAVRRIDVHAGTARWQRLYDEAAGVASDYELLHQVGPTPEERLDDLVALHDAINDAPLNDPGMEPDTWTSDRVASYDAAMAGRRQTVYRVLARHRRSGAWAGQSMLCVDEFAPALAFQEDTSVVRAHRGHRLGLLMKTDMLRWISRERPEVSHTDTWNAVTNHHMIAVNEALGAEVVAHFLSHTLDLG